MNNIEKQLKETATKFIFNEKEKQEKDLRYKKLKELENIKNNTLIIDDVEIKNDNQDGQISFSGEWEKPIYKILIINNQTI